MAKRKKAASKPMATRRTTRRGKQAAAESSATEGEASTPIEQTTETNNTASPKPDDTKDTDSNDNKNKASEPQISEISEVTTSKPSQVPIIALHKKFGKYRCLFTSDETYVRKCDVGSDSETNSSIDVRVVDPCASSESDSNAPHDIPSDTNSSRNCFSPTNSTINKNNSSSMDLESTLLMLHEPIQNVEIPLLNEISIHDSRDLESPSLLDDHSESHYTLEKVPMNSKEEDLTGEELPTVSAGTSKSHKENTVIPENHLENHIEYGDDEIITVVQIVEDDHTELFYDIKIDSPKEQTHVNLVEGTNKPQDGDLQNHFEKLNITSISGTNLQINCNEIIDITTPPCGTPDLIFSKENINEGLVRPDPSLTPSSTLSDDSNSSRVTDQNQNNSNDSSESSPTGVRRSNRIKTISSLKQKTKGYGLVKTPLKKALITQTKIKLEEIGSDSQERSDNNTNSAPNSPSFPVPSEMPVKVKSRWRRSSELEMGANSPASSPLASPNLPSKLPPVNELNNLTEEEQITTPLSKEAYDKIIEDRMNQYQHLDENEYLCDRMISKETKKMICDCFMTKEELERGELACGEDCLNRLLMIECNARCPVGDRCTNRRFQNRENSQLKVFYADKKGCGVEASTDIAAGEFLLEYVGEVLDYEQFYKRAQAYSDENNLHHYFMSLKGDTVIDATLKGNISRFINHSCDPNAETQKWTVNGELRIGFFSKRDIIAGEELTFDYQFQRFGKVAQRCYCGTDNCRGWIGGEPDSDDEDDEEEEEDISTSKSGPTESSEESLATLSEQPQQRPCKLKKQRKYKPKGPDLVQDADIEEDLEVLNRSGVKNQSHTLRLSRTVVRAKSRRAQIALLRLLRDADLPCRRLFLDYRGLRLLAPWCADALLDFKLEMLQTVDRLPIPNKTMVQESRFFTIVERWLSSAETPPDNVFIDESTGLPVNLPNQENAISPEKLKENAITIEKIKDLSNQLLDRWSGLKEVFKIPKKERIQQMKEHERQANVERRAADSSGTRDRDTNRDRDRDNNRDRERERRDERDRERERDKERERERERDRDREKEREKERERYRDRDRDRDDRDRRKRRGSPEGRRSIRLSERVLASIPPMSKEERRRAFAEAAAAADETRRHREHTHPHQHGHAHVHSQRWPPHYWPQPEHYPQMFPSVVGGVRPGMVAGCVGDVGPVGPVGPMGPEWVGPEFGPPPAFCPPFPGPQPFCMPQPNMMSMGGFGMGGFMFGQQMAPASAPFAPHPHLPPQPETNQPMTAPAVVGMSAGPSAMGVGSSVPVGEGQGGGSSGSGSGPPPPPEVVVLPSMWRSAQDQRGRTYYYHVKRRQPQWLPPPPPEAQSEESSSEEEEEQVNTLDSPLVRRQAKGKLVEGVNGIYEVIKEESRNGLIPDHALVTMRPRKRRVGLVTERPISPRTEEDKLAGRLEVKRYKQTKEKLRKRREKLLQKVRLLSTGKLKLRGIQEKLTNLVDLAETDSELEDESDETERQPVPAAVSSPRPPARSPPPPVRSPSPSPPASSPPGERLETARRIKEQFRSAMASVMVHHLNPYRHSDAPAGRITCTADFKHLARKLTHFVMLKELKHCRAVDELVVTDSVRAKAKTFVRKYMAKFGPVYKRPPEEID